MSPRLLLGSFLVMVVLSVVAAGLVAFPPPKPPAPTPLLEGLDPARVESLRLARDTDTQHVVRSIDGSWDCLWGPSDAPTRWPASETRVRSALRLLADSTLSSGPTVTPGPGATLHILADSQETLTLSMFGESVAGRAPVAVQRTDPGEVAPELTRSNARMGLTDDRLHSVFWRSGMLPWREDRALPGVARDPSLLSIIAPSAGGARLEVARVQGRWGVRSPIADRADPAAVQSAIEALARISIASFRDGASPADLGLDTPRVTIAVAGGRDRDAYTWTLDIGGPASADGNQVFARLSGFRGPPANSSGTLGPVYAVISLDALSGVFTNPEAYLARTSLATTPADIRRFRLTTPDAARTWLYERTIDGWQVTSPTASSPRAATQAEAAAIPPLLDMLSTTGATSMGLEAPAGFVPAATLTVEGVGSLAIESIVIGQAPTPQAGGTPAAVGPLVVTVQAGPTWRRYSTMPEFLSSLLPVAAP